MSNVNFVSEFNLLMRYSRNNGLSARERLLWIALFTIANDRAVYDENAKEYDWPDGFISIPNGELNLYSTLDKRGIETVRNSLKQRGLIDFVPGMRNKQVPQYKINYLSLDVGCKKVPNDVPNSVSNYVPNDVPSCATNNEPNHVPNHAPSHDSNTPGFGYKNAPNLAPITLNKRENINQSQREGKSGVTQGDARGRATPPDGFGFVNLDSGTECTEGFV